jgi:hypothetical protein
MLEKNGRTMRVHQLFTDFKKACDSVRKEVLYTILIGFWVSMKLVRLIKMYLNKINDKVCVGKYLLDYSPIQNGKKMGCLSLMFLNFALEYIIRKV